MGLDFQAHRFLLPVAEEQIINEQKISFKLKEEVA